MLTKIKENFKKYLITGFLILIPIGATFQILTWIISIGDGLFEVKNGKFFYFFPEEQVPYLIKNTPIPGTSFIFLVIVILLIGIIATSIFGNKIIKWAEELILKIPFLSKIYKITKQITETIFKSKDSGFNKVVLIEYPRKGVHAIGFITGNTPKEIININGKKFVNVFIPTTPNPTSGFLFMVPDDEIIYVDMSVEDAIKLVLSGGLVEPSENLSIIK